MSFRTCPEGKQFLVYSLQGNHETIKCEEPKNCKKHTTGIIISSLFKDAVTLHRFFIKGKIFQRVNRMNLEEPKKILYLDIKKNRQYE